MSRSYTFAQDGEYDIQILLARDLAGIVSGLREDRPHELLVLLDREPVATFTIQKPANGDDTLLDKDLKVRVAVHAGPHDIGVTFVKEGSSLIDTARQPTESRFNDRRHPRTAPAISQVSVTGPYAPKGVDGHAEPPPIVCVPANRTRQRTGRKVRGNDSVDADAARLSAADRQSRSCRADGLLSRRRVPKAISTPESPRR